MLRLADKSTEAIKTRKAAARSKIALPTGGLFEPHGRFRVSGSSEQRGDRSFLLPYY